MKKSIAIFTSVIAISAGSLFAGNNLTTNLNDLQIKINRVKKINNLEKITKEQNNKIGYLSKELKDTKYNLTRTKEHLKADSVNIVSLTENNKTLRSLKANLENSSLDTQQNLTASYHKNIKNIQDDNYSKMNDLLDKYTSDKKNLENTISELNMEVASQNKLVKNNKDTVVYYEDTINALNTTIATLSAQKRHLENDLTLTQQKTINAYKIQIDEINLKAENSVNKIKNQYAELTRKNNDETQTAKENFETKLAAEKRVLEDQLDVLIAKVNSYEDNLFQTSKYLTENANHIGVAASQLKKAYKEIPNPHPEKKFLGRVMTRVGIEDKNPSWETIQGQVKEMRINISILRGLSDNLAKSNLNNQKLLEENKNNSYLWGLFS